MRNDLFSDHDEAIHSSSHRIQIPKFRITLLHAFSVDIGLERPILAKLQIVVPIYSITFRTLPIAMVLFSSLNVNLPI